MTDAHAIKLLENMVRIQSYSGDESLLAAYLVQEMKELGLRSFQDEVGNAIGEIGDDPNSPLIMLLGHMDTVPGNIEVRREGSILYGRGAVDAKGPLATFICSAAKITRSNARLIVVGAVEEETSGSRGARFLLERYAPDAVIIGEPSGWSSAVLGYKGRMGFTYEVERPPSHTAGPGERATEVATEFWSHLTQYLAKTDSEQSNFYRTTAALCKFEGDIEHAHLEITCRTKPNFNLHAFEQFLTEISSRGQILVHDRTPSVRVERTDPVVRSLINAIRKHGGHPSYKLKTGTSDMNTIRQQWIVPMAAYGPGDSSLDHTDFEHIDLDEFLRAIDVLYDALTTLTTALSRRVSP